MFGDGAAEDDFLEVAAFEFETVGGVFVGDADDVLFDDGAGVEFAGDVVAGGSDDLDSAVEGLLVGVCAYECGEEGVVDVYDVMGVGGDHPAAEDLHVAGEDDEADAFFLEEGHFFGFDLFEVGVVFGYGPDVVGYVELLGYVPEVIMIAYDTGYFDVPLPCLVTGEEVVEAVAHLADEYGHPGLDIAEEDAELQGVPAGEEGADVFLDLFAGDQEAVEFPFDAHEEAAFDAVDVLVEIDNVSAVFGDEAGDVGDDALPVWAVEEEYYCGVHKLLITFGLARLILPRPPDT